MEQIKGTQRRISINGTELERTHGILMWTHSYMEMGNSILALVVSGS